MPQYFVFMYLWRGFGVEMQHVLIGVLGMDPQNDKKLKPQTYELQKDYYA